jgi:hypothetical protein
MTETVHISSKIDLNYIMRLRFPWLAFPLAPYIYTAVGNTYIALGLSDRRSTI